MKHSAGRFISLTAILLGFGIDARAATLEPCAINGDVKSDAWRTQCDEAVAREADATKRAALLFGRAYGAIELYRYDDALTDLNAALSADPDNPRYLHERAYVYGELSEFPAAIADLDRQISLQPNEPTAFRERAYARRYVADLKGAYEDRARELELEPESASSLFARGQAAMWLGRFDDATADAMKAQKLAKSAGDERGSSEAAELLTRLGHWRDVSRGANPGSHCKMESLTKDKPSTRIGDCTRAFFEATTGSAKADALTTRHTAWLVLANSPDDSEEDLRIAVAFDPGNAERHINLGYSYLSNRHSWAARREFDRALAIDEHWLAFAGRGAARLNLNEIEGAIADARASMDLHPNEAAARLIGDIAFTKGDREGARSSYLIVYRLGSRDNGLIERLKELGVPDPAQAMGKDAAK